MQITGNTTITPSHRYEMSSLRLANIGEEIVEGYAGLADAVHAEDGLILAQLSHSALLSKSANTFVVAASDYSVGRTGESARALTRGEISALVEDYAAAAERTARGRLDGVELLMARGSLLSTFLSPAFNYRSDEWGGSFEGRLKFPLEVLRRVRAELAGDAILGVRISADEFIENGLDASGAAEIVNAFEAEGLVDYVSVTGGTPTHRTSFPYGYPATPLPFGLFRDLAGQIKRSTSTPIAYVGRVTNPEVAASIIDEGDADLVGVARAQIADPEFFAKAAESRSEDIRPCVGANECANHHLAGRMIRCIANPGLGREREWLETEPAQTQRRYVVVGAGPAGLEASRVLAQRGHLVEVIDENSETGGQMRAWTRSASRREFKRLSDWWARSAKKDGVSFSLGERATIEGLLSRTPDGIVLATGARPAQSPFTSADPSVTVVPMEEALGGRVTPGRVVVFDDMGRVDACLVAEYLRENGSDVTLVTSEMYAAQNEGEASLYPIIEQLLDIGVEIVSQSEIDSIGNGHVMIRNMFRVGRCTELPADSFVHVSGYRADDELRSGLEEAGQYVVTIGDALQPRRVHNAVFEGAATGRMIEQDLGYADIRLLHGF